MADSTNNDTDWAQLVSGLAAVGVTAFDRYDERRLATDAQPASSLPSTGGLFAGGTAMIIGLVAVVVIAVVLLK